MTNFSKFDVIYSTVTKPEGSFACDDKTDLKRFMWVMTYDVSAYIIFYHAVNMNKLTLSPYSNSVIPGQEKMFHF